MKRLWKRAFAFVCSGALLLSGCALRSTLPEEAAPVSLTLWTLQQHAATLSDAIASFDEAEIVLTAYEMEDYKKKLSMVAATDEMPDIFFVWEAGYFAPLVREGKMLPLTAYLDGTQELSHLDALSQLMVDGELYAIPMEQSLSVVYYNKEILAACELTPPEHWEDFADCCQELLRHGVTPLAVSMQDSWHAGELLTAILAGEDGSLLFDRLAQGASWDCPEVSSAMETLSSMAAKGYAQLKENASDDLRKGRAAMMLGGDWCVPFLEDDAQIGAFLLPAQSAQHQGCAIHSVDQCYGISAQCQMPELAWEFLKNLAEKIRTAKLEPEKDESTLAREVQALYQEVSDSVLWVDRGIGGEVGAAFNQMALAVLSGRDWEEELEQFLKAVQ